VTTIYQIYFDESQRAGLDYIPYRNDDCTVYFESAVMCRLVEAGAHRASDYFGVVSYQLRQKIEGTRESWKHNEGIASVSARDFTPEMFERELRRETPDAMSFVRHAPHDPVTLAALSSRISRTSTDCGARNSERAVYQMATTTFTARRTTKYATTV
jgi:hypothetical protein